MRNRIMNKEDHKRLLVCFGQKLAHCRRERKFSQAREPGLFIVVIMAEALEIKHTELLEFQVKFE